MTRKKERPSDSKPKENLGQAPFVLDERLLREYPELQELSGIPTREVPIDTLRISAAYIFIRQAEECLNGSRKEDESSSGLAYRVLFARECLKKLDGTGRYGRFVESEENRAGEFIRRVIDESRSE